MLFRKDNLADRKILISYFGYILLTVYLGYFLFWIYDNISLFLCSDLFTELMFADLQAKTKDFFVETWFYSTEIRVINMQLVYTPLFLIFNDWEKILFVGIFIWMLIYVFSFLFLYRRLKLSMTWFPYFSVILICPLNWEYIYFVEAGNYYLPFLCITMWTLALMLPILDKEKNKKWVLASNALLSVILAFVSSLGGIRMFICLYLPLFLASLCLLFREEKNILNLQFKKTKYLDFFILNICNVFASGFGYIINLKILAKQYKFTDFTFLRWSYIREQSIIDIINTWLENFGYVANVNLLGHRALRHNIFCFSIIILIILAVFYGIRNKEKKYNFLALFYCAAIFVTTALFTFSEMGITGRYIYPFAFIFVILLACGFERFEKKIKYLLLFFVQLFAIICIVFINDYSLYSEGYNKEVEKEIVDFLTERDLLQGYAMGENLTYYSNGEIEVWRLEECQEENESRYLQVRPFLQSITHTQQLPEGETFFVLEKSSYEENRMYRELIDVGQKAFENDRYIVFLYDTAEELVEDLEIR